MLALQKMRNSTTVYDGKRESIAEEFFPGHTAWGRCNEIKAEEMSPTLKRGRNRSF
jgi:hypothetical protein